MSGDAILHIVGESIGLAKVLASLIPAPAQVAGEIAQDAVALSLQGQLEPTDADLRLSVVGPKLFADALLKRFAGCVITGSNRGGDCQVRDRKAGGASFLMRAFERGQGPIGEPRWKVGLRAWLALPAPQAPRVMWPRYQQETRTDYKRRLENELGLGSVWKVLADMSVDGDFEGKGSPDFNFLFAPGTADVPADMLTFVETARQQAGVGLAATRNADLALTDEQRANRRRGSSSSASTDAPSSLPLVVVAAAAAYWLFT